VAPYSGGMKLLLTSAGIANDSIGRALENLLGKPVSSSHALFVPTAIYPFSGGSRQAMRAVRGQVATPLAELEWGSLGLLELTALPSLKPEHWAPALEEADALLVYGGNVAYLAHWLRESGVAALLPTLPNLLYVGVSAGTIAVTPSNCDAAFNREVLPIDSSAARHADHGLGLVPFTTWVHVGHPDPMFEDHTMANAAAWARSSGYATYALDDESALSVVDGEVTVISEGTWVLFEPGSTTNN